MLGERRRDEPLGADGRRLSLIVRRHQVQVRLGDLDIKTEDAIVADLQRRNTGPRPLGRFHRRDGGAPPVRQLGQLVELGPETGPDESGLEPARRHLLGQRPLQERTEVVEREQRRRK